MNEDLLGKKETRAFIKRVVAYIETSTSTLHVMPYKDDLLAECEQRLAALDEPDAPLVTLWTTTTQGDDLSLDTFDMAYFWPDECLEDALDNALAGGFDVCRVKARLVSAIAFHPEEVPEPNADEESKK